MINRRILVIDDNPSIHDDFRRILQSNESAFTLFEARATLFDEVSVAASREGFEVDCADQGQAGLALVQSAMQRGCPYAVAFIDMRMPPGWDGVETLEHLWRIDPDLQAVICTAFADLDWDRIIQRFSCSDQLLVLRKPFDVIEVWQAANALTQKWCLTQQVRQRFDTLTAMVEQRTQALREVNEQLQQDIARRQQIEAELHHAKDAAETASHAKNQFLANMSHEIRTPITGIIGLSDLVLDTDLTLEQQQYVALIKTSADALLTVINDILDFSKIEAGKLTLTPHAFQLRDSLDSAVWMLALAAHTKRLELICHVQPDVPDALIGDTGRLRQTVVNLISNAIKFTEQGEVVLGAEIASQTQEEISLHFTVRDTGLGIPQEKQAAIFEAFTQVDSSTTRQHVGTGLGLAIATELVELMGGRLWVESVVGQGSTFHFLARFGLPPQQPARPSSTELVHMHGVRVLVVEDHSTQQRMLVELLQHWDMQPVAVASAQEALRALEHAHQAGKPFALLLLDTTLPEGDGVRLAKHITQHPELVVAVIRMLTAVGQQDQVEHYSQPGLVASMLKPIRQGDLLQAILTALGRLPQRDQHTLLESPPPVLPGSQPYRVLLAEDNAVNQRILVRLLEKRGHTVAVAESGRKVLAMLEREPFDLVLMDVQMPEVDGLTVTATIRHREQQTATHLPIIAMTAYAMDDDRKRCLEAGMDAYLSKPFHAAKLFDAIARLMSPGPRQQ